MQNDRLIDKLNRINFCSCGDIKVGTALACLIKTGMKIQNLDYMSDVFYMVSDYKVRTEGNFSVCFLLSSYNIVRKDQTVMFETVANTINNKLVIEAIECSKKVDISYIYLVPIWYYQLSKLKISSWKKKLIVMYMYHYIVEAYIIMKIINKYKLKLVAVFDDIYPIDNIVVQLCRRSGKKTSTFHHGIINGTYGYMEYKYSQSDYYLAWGEYTKDMAVKYGIAKDKIKVLGPLTKLNRFNEEKQFVERKVIGVSTRNVIGKKYVSDNIELLNLVNEFAEKYGYKYIIRYHPSDRNRYEKYINKNLCINISNSKRIKESLHNFLDNVDFVICANSTVYADTLEEGKMAFRYIPDYEIDEDVCKGIEFGRISSYEELEYIYNSEGINKNKIEEVSNYIFKHGDIAQNYRTFFEKFK